MLTCPKCKSNHIHRSHRRGPIEQCMSLAGYYPYNCHHCKARFVGARETTPQSPSKHRGMEREIKATRDAKKARRKRREVLLYSTAVVLFLAFLYFITRDHGAA